MSLTNDNNNIYTESNRDRNTHIHTHLYKNYCCDTSTIITITPLYNNLVSCSSESCSHE